MTVNVRLEQTGVFSPEAVQVAAELDAYQRSFPDYPAFFRAAGVPDKPASFTPTTGNPIDVLHIRPQSGEYDSKRARVYRFPFACPPDSNMLYHVASLQIMRPKEQLIAFPGWSGRGYSSSVLDRKDLLQVASGNFRPLVEGSLQYLASQGVEEAEVIGFSGGASQVPEHARYAEKYDHRVTHAVSIEPADMLRWRPHRLAGAFLSTNAALQSYVQANANPQYEAARANAEGGLNYVQCFMRASSLALGWGLARGGFEGRADQALDQNPELNLHVIWGQESELAVNAVATEVVGRLHDAHDDRVSSLVVPNARHMWVNDLSLQHAALATVLPQ